jgi:hypothetical protein
VGVCRHQTSVVGVQIRRGVALDDVPAGGLGHDDVLAGPNRLGQGADIPVGLPAERLELPVVQPWGPAAACTVGEVAADPVALIHLHQVLADRRVLVLDQAGSKDDGPRLLRPAST